MKSILVYYGHLAARPGLGQFLYVFYLDEILELNDILSYNRVFNVIKKIYYLGENIQFLVTIIFM